MAEHTEREIWEHLFEICRDGERDFQADRRHTFARDLEPHVKWIHAFERA